MSQMIMSIMMRMKKGYGISLMVYLMEQMCFSVFGEK